MYELSVQLPFDAAHYLRDYQGKCEALHGHRFLVGVGVRGKELDKAGMLYDFVELKKHLREVIAPLDHSCLNDLPAFQQTNPSSENIARYIYEQLKPRLEGVELFYVEVGETPENRARFIPEGPHPL